MTFAITLIIHYSASISMVTWSEHFFAMGMSIAPMTGEVYWSRLSIVIEVMTYSDSSVAMQPLLTPRFIAISKQRGIPMRYD